MALSPMMQQYIDIKEANQDALLFFRVGDFYELFFEDAKTASRELDLVLTGKSCGLPERAPMCGVPFHSADSYVASLVDKGYRVAICEQMTDPAESKGLVEREVVRVVTPGTITSGTMLTETENNYLASCVVTAKGVGLAYADISTGEVQVTGLSGVGRADDLYNELVRIGPKELLWNEEATVFLPEEDLAGALPDSVTKVAEDRYSLPALRKLVVSQFPDRKAELSEKDRTVILALGMLLQYLRDTQKQDMDQLITLVSYDLGSHMALDRATIVNL